MRTDRDAEWEAEMVERMREKAFGLPAGRFKSWKKGGKTNELNGAGAGRVSDSSEPEKEDEGRSSKSMENATAVGVGPQPQ